MSSITYIQNQLSGTLKQFAPIQNDFIKADLHPESFRRQLGTR